MNKKVYAVLDKFSSDGYTIIGFNGQYVYGCHEGDIPRGALDAYASINSKQAKLYVLESLAQGYSYS